VLDDYFRGARSDEYSCSKPKFTSSQLFKLVIWFPSPFVTCTKCSLQRGWAINNREKNEITFSKAALLS